MHIILTHEQADFDAIASLLGAYLLDEAALPVLPYRINRNVQAYLAFYGADLPFFQAKELPNKPIEQVTLVDTQSITSIKGMGPATRTNVIDHHPEREKLPKDWEVMLADIGATTTLLVEALRENDRLLTPIQSTLLLLGIYEDTGSLTYTRTKARDLQAAAFLIEQGASLKIASDFLNHPLSSVQQIIYDQLRANSIYLNIHGHRIVIATGDAQEMDEELSTIVHKLRDLLDPDALFVIVKTRAGVQMIARSTTDNIDVAEILSTFGGGGHERAAAGLVRNQEPEQVQNNLKDSLPNYVHPAITVAKIMSRGAQIISPDTPLEEARRRILRYGYEGYPVVQNGNVIGLLTRRSVDRGINHNLEVTVSSVMDAGSFTVKPDDPIEHLQRIMTESGWGQIPVINPEDQQIIGIVTRTDLLKTLTPEPKIPGHQNLAARMEISLPDEHLALLKAISKSAHDERVALYIVGGFVRDLWLNLPSVDFDLVVEGDAIKLAKSLERAYGGRVTSHAFFGTAKWLLAGSIFSNMTEPKPPFGSRLEAIDLVTARTEFYTHPTALPTVERGSIKLDLHRRDFTINTLAMRLDGHHYGELYDYWGGINDLRQGLVRVLHSLSFVDDPTRMLRAVRFEQRFGFQIEKRTLELMQEAIPLIDRVSGDRIRHELNHIVIERAATQIIARLDDLSLLAAIDKNLVWDSWLEDRFHQIPTTCPDEYWNLNHQRWVPDRQQSLSYLLWFLRLSVKDASWVAKRLRIPVDLSSNLHSSINLWQDLPSLAGRKPSQVTSRLKDVPLLACFAVYLATENRDQKELLELYASTWRKITPTISGHDLRKLGITPGPVYRSILAELRDAWLNGKITTPEEENELLQELLSASNQN